MRQNWNDSSHKNNGNASISSSDHSLFCIEFWLHPLTCTDLHKHLHRSRRSAFLRRILCLESSGNVMVGTNTGTRNNHRHLSLHSIAKVANIHIATQSRRSQFEKILISADAMSEVKEVHLHQDASIYSHLQKNRFHLEQRIYKLSVNHLKYRRFLITTIIWLPEL